MVRNRVSNDGVDSDGLEHGCMTAVVKERWRTVADCGRRGDWPPLLATMSGWSRAAAASDDHWWRSGQHGWDAGEQHRAGGSRLAPPRASGGGRWVDGMWKKRRIKIL
jgi:hypothetical protein